jgi:hypothetical protein
LRHNTGKAQEVVRRFAQAWRDETCACHSAANGAILTDPARIPPRTRRRLDLLYGKYWRK